MNEEQVSKTVLVIDDDITSLDIISLLFEDRGFVVERCAGGKEALALLETVAVKVVLIDIMMPEMDGIETVEKIRQRGLKDLPIIAFSANDNPEILEKARVAGCNKVLTKPLRAEKLLQEIEAFLD